MRQWSALIISAASTCTVSRGGALLTFAPLWLKRSWTPSFLKARRAERHQTSMVGGGTGHGKEKTKKKGTGLSAADRNPLSTGR